MKEKLAIFKEQGYSIRQLFVLGKAIAMGIPTHIIENKDYTPREMNQILDIYQKKNKEG